VIHSFEVIVSANIEHNFEVQAESAEEARIEALAKMIGGEGDIVSNVTVERCIMLDEEDA